VSHDRDFANKYGDRIIEFADGKIISDRENTIKTNKHEDVT
jgi:ABC-type phosphate/phosphonate transport system ATPase subunit